MNDEQEKEWEAAQESIRFEPVGYEPEETLALQITQLEGILAQEDVEFGYATGQIGGFVPVDELTSKLIWEGLQVLLKQKREQA